MKYSLLLLAFAGPLLLLVMGCIPNSSTDPQAQKEIIKSNPLDRVTASLPTRKTLQLFSEQPGRVEAFEEAPIHSKLAGYVETVHVDIGDKVTKAQVLVRIHAPEYQDQLEQKRGLLAQAEAELKQVESALNAAQAAVNSSKSMVIQADASVARAEAECTRWNSELQRIQQLVSKGSVTSKLADETSSQLLSAEAARKESLASVEVAKARQTESEASVAKAMADIDVAQAKIRVAQSQIAQAETMVSYMDLTAPFDGYVTDRKVAAGHYVQPAGASESQPLIKIANLSRIRVFVNIPESEAAWVDANFGSSLAGDPVTILSPALPNGKIESRVTRTNLQLDPQSRSLTVEIDLDNNDLKILPGTFVTTKLLLEQRENVLTLPLAALIKTNEGTKCCMVTEGKIQHRPIELGLRVGDEVEIRLGLDGSETLVMARAAALQAGQEVEVLKKK